MKILSAKDKEIHDQFSRYGKNAKEWMNKCVLMLPKIEKNRIWEKKGFFSIYEYAAKIAGMSRNKVNEGLRILKKTENLPAIRRVIEKRGIFAVKPVVNIATEKTDLFWARKAFEMNKGTLEIFVRDYRKEQEEKFLETDNPGLKLGRPGAGSPINYGSDKPRIFQKNLDQNVEDRNSRIQVSMKLDLEISNALKEIKGEGNWNEVMRKLLKFSKKGLEDEQKQLETKEKQLQKELKKEKPEKIKSNNHTVNAAIKKYIKKRSKGRCEHPNCNKPGKHIHHLEPFALKKEHDPDKLVYLCEEHHQIIHLGYIDDSQITPGGDNVSQQSIANSWSQIEQLPYYDMKNFINQRIAEFGKYNNPKQLII